MNRIGGIVREVGASGSLVAFAALTLIVLIAALVISLGPGSAEAAPCTKGVNCYCDRVQGGNLNDPALLFCEDFEAPTLVNNQGVGNGAPYHGPWYDDSRGFAGNRGENSYWYRKYGNGTNSFLFSQGQPASPTFGAPCAYSLCVGAKVWDQTNRWGGNAYNPQLAFLNASQFDAELSTIRPPSNAAGGGSGAFDGAVSLGYRIAAGRTHGIGGGAHFPATRNIGYTAAIAYANNSMTAGIWGTTSIPASWKHNEWGTVYNPNSGLDGLFIFYNQAGPRTGIPFAGFLGSFKDQNYTNCASIVRTAGSAQCIGANLGIQWNTPANYSQPTDWPFGTWGCVRGFIENAGLSNMRMRVWFQGPNMTSERLIIDFTANGTQLDNKQGYSSMGWNAYANTNQGTGYVPTTQMTFRYEDNTHARAGVPVPCAQIGFSGSSTVDIVPPAMPSGVTTP